MAKNLRDLQDHLFAQIERLNNPALKGEELAAEVKRTHALCSLAGQSVAAGKLGLDARRLAREEGSTLINRPRALTSGDE